MSQMAVAMDLICVYDYPDRWQSIHGVRRRCCCMSLQLITLPLQQIEAQIGRNDATSAYTGLLGLRRCDAPVASPFALLIHSYSRRSFVATCLHCTAESPHAASYTTSAHCRCVSLSAAVAMCILLFLLPSLECTD